MRTRWVISLIVLGAFILLPQFAIADDLADLKATHMRLLEAVNTGDVKTMFEYWQEAGIYFGDEMGFPIVSIKARDIPMFTKWFETHTLGTMWYKVDYRIIGNTGVVWGTRMRTVRNKTTGVGKRTSLKTSMVFMKSEGKWEVIMEHNTPIPTEVDLF